MEKRGKRYTGMCCFGGGVDHKMEESGWIGGGREGG